MTISFKNVYRLLIWDLLLVRRYYGFLLILLFSCSTVIFGVFFLKEYAFAHLIILIVYFFFKPLFFNMNRVPHEFLLYIVTGSKPIEILIAKNISLLLITVCIVASFVLYTILTSPEFIQISINIIICFTSSIFFLLLLVNYVSVFRISLGLRNESQFRHQLISLICLIIACGPYVYIWSEFQSRFLGIIIAALGISSWCILLIYHIPKLLPTTRQLDDLDLV